MVPPTLTPPKNTPLPLSPSPPLPLSPSPSLTPPFPPCLKLLSLHLQLVQQPVTTPLGLVMLQTASEELASPREDLSIARKNELRRLLIQEVPAVLTLLTQLLDRVLEKHRRVATTVTPPPSPTHGMSPARSASPTVPGGSPLLLFSTSPLNAADPTLQQTGGNNLVGRLLNLSPKSRQNLGHPLPPLDPESEDVSCLALKCLAHLFSWIPLSSMITPALVSTVFYFAEFGCNVPSGSSSSTSAAASSRLGKLSCEGVLTNSINQSTTLFQSRSLIAGHARPTNRGDTGVSTVC